MVSFTSVFIAALAATGVSAQTNCPNGRLMCGWLLNSPPYNVAQSTLEAAAQSTDRHFVFHSIYRCGSEGRITWSSPCNSPLNCQNIPEQSPDAFCRV